MAGEITCVRLRIDGLVQGVGYRVWTRRTALDLGLQGWVRNRRDGNVEAVVWGAPAAIETMVARCRKGPVHADVASVEISPATPSDAPDHGFDILRDA